MVQARSEQYQPIGYLTKPHGVDGSIETVINEEAVGYFEQCDILWLTDVNDMLIPLRRDTCRQDHQRNNVFFVKFVGIDSRDEIFKYSGRKLYTEAQELNNALNQASGLVRGDLIEFSVLDEKQQLAGRVVDIMENPAHDILILDSGLLIPFVEEYINAVNEETQIIEGKHLDRLKEI